MGFRSFVIHVANDLKLNQMELVQLPGKQVHALHGFYGIFDLSTRPVSDLLLV